MIRKFVVVIVLFSVCSIALAAPRDRVAQLASQTSNIDLRVLSMALDAAQCAQKSGLGGDHRLTVIDYSKPSTAARLWVFDLRSNRLLFEERVAHGKNTGANMAESFSNIPGSKQTSIGMYRTAGTYHGSNGYSLRLDGLEPGFNDKARERAIVMHGAWYVNDALIETQGRIGRSWGCPALRKEIAGTVIDTIKGGSLLFAYYPDADYLATSKLVAQCAGDAPSQLAP